MEQQQAMRIFTMADESYCLSIRNGEVIVTPANPADQNQHWFKDTTYSTVKGDGGFPGFSLINKATGQAIKHAVGARQPVRLAPYSPNKMDKSVLWTESNDIVQGFRAIRMLTNHQLNLDALGLVNNIRTKQGDGTKVGVWQWLNGPNQRWKIAPWSEFKNTNVPCCCPQPIVRILTKADENYSLSIRGSNVILAPSNPDDELQQWIKDMSYGTIVKDENGFLSFALVNKATGQAIQHSIGARQPVRLVPYKPEFDESILWTESNDTSEGFRRIRMVNNIKLCFDAFDADAYGRVNDGTVVGLWDLLEGKNQMWKIVPHKSK